MLRGLHTVIDPAFPRTIRDRHTARFRRTLFAPVHMVFRRPGSRGHTGARIRPEVHVILRPFFSILQAGRGYASPPRLIRRRQRRRDSPAPATYRKMMPVPCSSASWPVCLRGHPILRTIPSFTVGWSLRTVGMPQRAPARSFLVTPYGHPISGPSIHPHPGSGHPDRFIPHGITGAQMAVRGRSGAVRESSWIGHLPPSPPVSVSRPAAPDRSHGTPLALPAAIPVPRGTGSKTRRTPGPFPRGINRALPLRQSGGQGGAPATRGAQLGFRPAVPARVGPPQIPKMASGGAKGRHQ